jgi:hypothetical protein
MTLLGEAVYERAYYYCRSCRQGDFPTDEELGVLHKQTPAAREVTTLVGVLEPFEEGARQVLPKLCGLNLSASTVQRVTEEVGQDVADRRAAGETFAPPQRWDWNLDATGQKVAYVSVDATGVVQQGPHHEKVEGRMPWVATVFNPQPTHENTRRRRVWDAHYLSGLMSLPEIGGQLRRQCQSVGLAAAEVVIGLTDGGAGLENCLIDAVAGMARELVFILDFYHASEHLQEFAKVLEPHDEVARQQQMQAWCQTLKHRGGRALFDELEALDFTRASPAIRAARESLLGYFRNNLHRMDYPTYIARGWQIGSGMIESACKCVVGQRLKQSGMRWREPGTQQICHLRALYKSQPNLWTHYWDQTTSA